MEPIKIKKTDLAFVISEDGEIEVYLPKKEELSGKALRVMLQEIRKAETLFIEIANQTFGEE